MPDPPFVNRADPDEVFALLSNDTRVKILQSICKTDEDETTFSDLREAVGVRDSGQFNYHLNELVGRFVVKTEDGYELTQAGKQINGAIEAGTYTAEGSLDTIALEAPCPTCGGDRTLHYEDETVQVACDSCFVSYQFGVPPAVFAGCDRETVPRVAGQYLETKIQHITSGFCPFCDGSVAPTVEPVSEIEPDTDPPESVSQERIDPEGHFPMVKYPCQQCGAEPTLWPSIAFLDHPAVVSFYYDRGVNVQDHIVWDFADADPDYQTVRSREPLRANVTYTCDGDKLTVTIDGDLSVVEVER
jgi:hypothetical protein